MPDVRSSFGYLTGDDRHRLAGRVEEVLEKNACTREQLLQRVGEAVAACNIKINEVTLD